MKIQREEKNVVSKYGLTMISRIGHARVRCSGSVLTPIKARSNQLPLIREFRTNLTHTHRPFREVHCGFTIFADWFGWNGLGDFQAIVVYVGRAAVVVIVVNIVI